MVLTRQGMGIRERLLGAYIIVVLIALVAVLISWFSLTRTQDKLDTVVSETLPLVHNSLKLDKEARFFALTINEFPEITTDREYNALTGRLRNHSLEIRTLLHTLERLNFESKQLVFVHDRVELLDSLMREQDQHFHEFFSVNHQLLRVVDSLQERHRLFIGLANPRISECYEIFQQKGNEVTDEIRTAVTLAGNGLTQQEKKHIDDKLRVGFETLISSAAGEMRASLEAVALTHLASGLLSEAAIAKEVETVRRLQAEFTGVLPKIRKVQLILSHSSPDNHQIIVSAIPIFRYGIGSESIFSLRVRELLLRKQAAVSAKNALALAGELTDSITNLTFTAQALANQAADSIRSSLNLARLIQIMSGITAVLFSIIIGWFYVNKRVVERLSALKNAMELQSVGKEAKIPLFGNDEISDMAGSLERFVNQRTSIEQQLRTTLDELNAVMDTIDYGIAFMDGGQKVILVNKAFRRMWNVRETDILGMSAAELVSRHLTSLGPDGGEHLLGISAKGERDWPSQPPARRELETDDGRALQYQAIGLDGGYTMLTFFDITELKQNQAKLMRAQRIETIGLMAGGVAHDLNNILSGIVSYPDLLLLKLPEQSPLRKTITEIKESGLRAAAVVADLLTVTRGASVERQVDNLNRLVEQYLESPEALDTAALYPQVTMAVKLSPDLLNLSCVPVQIKKCLMNLVVNGAEAIVESGVITLETRNHYVEGAQDGDRQLKGGEYVVLSVSDNGPGILPEHLDHVFEPFYSRKVMGRSGTGLGLTIVWNTVQDHGGAITIESNENGTTFELYFPVIREKLPGVDGRHPEDVVTGNNELVLVVDDEELQRNIVLQVLEALGYRGMAVASGEEAIELVKKREFDLIILDMIMSPGMNGKETFSQIVRSRPGQKAVIATGFSVDSEVIAAQELGVGGVIHKPYTLYELGDIVKQVLRSA